MRWKMASGSNKLSDSYVEVEEKSVPDIQPVAIRLQVWQYAACQKWQIDDGLPHTAGR